MAILQEDSGTPVTASAQSSVSRTTTGPCAHGGAFFHDVGVQFDNLQRRHAIINADVLDAWFPPAPGVLKELQSSLDWILRTSPPTQCEGLVQRIAECRQVPAASLVVGAGSSDLLFRALPRWLTRQSRVLLPDPTYGEYQHVLRHVVGCHVDRFELDPADDFVINPARLSAALRGCDLVVLVNPNNPTGAWVPRQVLEDVILRAPAETRFWIDEAYIDYVDSAESMESCAVKSANVVVCKSMSKVYALSGARVAYLCGAEPLIADVRRVTPPWVVSLTAQIAGVRALEDPGYYAEQYCQTRMLRARLVEQLVDIGLHVWPGCANYILCRLPVAALSVAELVRRCRAAGLFVRDVSPMSSRPLDRVFRIAVKDADTNSRMLAILRTVILPR